MKKQELGAHVEQPSAIWKKGEAFRPKNAVPSVKYDGSRVILNEFYQFCREEWSNIQPELQQKLVDGYDKHHVEVQNAKGHLTKYYWGVYISETRYILLTLCGLEKNKNIFTPLRLDLVIRRMLYAVYIHNYSTLLYKSLYCFYSDMVAEVGRFILHGTDNSLGAGSIIGS